MHSKTPETVIEFGLGWKGTECCKNSLIFGGFGVSIDIKRVQVYVTKHIRYMLAHKRTSKKCFPSKHRKRGETLRKHESFSLFLFLFSNRKNTAECRMIFYADRSVWQKKRCRVLSSLLRYLYVTLWAKPLEQKITKDPTVPHYSSSWNMYLYFTIYIYVYVNVSCHSSLIVELRYTYSVFACYQADVETCMSLA